MTMFTPDLLHGIITDLDRATYETVSIHHPAIAKLLSKTPQQLRAQEHNWNIAYRGPGSGRQLTRGTVLPGGRKNFTAQARATVGAWVYGYDFDEMDIALAQSMDEAAIVIEGQAAAAIADVTNLFAAQLLNGTAAEGTGGLPTLNGDTDFDPTGDGSYLEPGLIQFDAPASQTGTAFNVVREGGAGGIPGHANQFGEVTSVAGVGPGGGLRELMALRMQCSKRGVREKVGMPDMGIADTVSFQNYYERFAEQVVPIVYRDGSQIPEDIGREGLVITKGLVLHWEPEFDPDSAPFTAGYNGMIYLLTTKDIHPLALPQLTPVSGTQPIKGGKNMLGSFLSHRRLIESQDTLGLKATMLGSLGLAIKNLSAHGALIGTANP